MFQQLTLYTMTSRPAPWRADTATPPPKPFSPRALLAAAAYPSLVASRTPRPRAISQAKIFSRNPLFVRCRASIHYVTRHRVKATTKH